MRPRWMEAGGNATLGLEMVLSALFGFFGGQWLDGKLGTAPYLASLGFFFGIAAAIRALFRATKRMQRATETDGFKASQTDRPARFALEQKEGR